MTYILDGGTNNLSNPSTYNIETPSITFLAPTKTGYDFNGWTITGVSKGSTGNKTTTAS
ncbi:MAG: InlB B-repeat-containing protein [Candidatus Margulisbacteria bacterium]|nr:InlB B-repeat-containing protein [Candidatus Margulisiibacteriota bacterium]